MQGCVCCKNRIFVDPLPDGAPGDTMDVVIKNPTLRFEFNEVRVSMRSDGLLMLARELINKAIDLNARTKEQ